MSADVAPQWPDPDCAGQPTITEFCERHDLVDALAPFAHRAYDPWALARAFDAEFEKLPATAATLTASELFERATGTRNVWGGHFRAPLYLIGSWPLSDPDGRRGRWVNPYYPHERALAPVDAESRAEHLRTCCDLAVFSQADLAARFDLTPRSLEGWFDRRGFDWAARRRRARRRVGRTLTAAAEWTGVPLTELVRCLPVSYPTVQYWRREHVSRSDWSAPDDPSLVGGERA